MKNKLWLKNLIMICVFILLSGISLLLASNKDLFNPSDNKNAEARDVLVFGVYFKGSGRSTLYSYGGGVVASSKNTGVAGGWGSWGSTSRNSRNAASYIYGKANEGYSVYGIYRNENNKTFWIDDNKSFSFSGWNSQETVTEGICTRTGSNKSSDYNYIVVFCPIQYTVTLDVQAGSGVTKAYPYYDSTMPTISVPTRQGYTFQGYYSLPGGNGTKYYNSDGTGAKVWKSTASGTTLYAYWTANQYSVTLKDQNGTSTYGSVMATYDSPMPTLSSNLIPSKTGYTFQGYYWNTNGGGDKYYYSNGTSAHNWTTVGSSWLAAYFTANSYTLTMNANGGSIPYSSNWGGGGSSATKSVKYDSAYGNLPTPIRNGYNFDGWYTTASGNTKVTSSTTMTSLGATIYAQWTEIEYTIKFDVNGGNPVSSLSYYITTKDKSLPKATKTGYTFKGWKVTTIAGNWNSTEPYLEGKTVNGMFGSPTLTAQWTANNYNLNFDPQGGNGGTKSMNVVYGDKIPQSVTEIPNKYGYDFKGYYTETKGEGTRYYDENGIRVYDGLWQIADGGTVYAYWTPKVYMVDVNILNPNGNQDYASGTMTYYNSYSGNTYTGQADQPESYIQYGGNIKISNISPATGMIIERVYSTRNKGSISLSNGIYTYTINYGESPSGGWDDEIVIKMKWGSYTLTADANGGSILATDGWSGNGKTVTKEVLFNNAYGNMPTPTRSGYLFLGWFMAKSGGSEVTAATKMMTEGATIYAHWSETWAATNVNAFGGGDGDVKSPYKIKTVDQLAYLSKAVQSGETFAGKYFEQTAPIDLSGKIWMPIGGNNTDKAFGGYYNGNGFAIIGLNTYAQTDANKNQLFSGVGLFGRTNGATLTNVYLTNANIVGNGNVGGLVGENVGKNLTIYGCFVKGKVTGTTNVGGLVGNDGVLTLRVSNSGFAGDVKGGSIIVGKASASIIKNCYAEVNSNIPFCGSGASITACVYSAGSNKRYYNDTATGKNYFADWKTYNGKPLPKGLTWMGGVASGSFSLAGYTKVG